MDTEQLWEMTSKILVAEVLDFRSCFQNKNYVAMSTTAVSNYDTNKQ